MILKKYCFLFFVLIVYQSIFAQKRENKVIDSLKGQTLQEVIISSLHINNSLLNTPAAIGVLSKSELTQNNTTDISIVINTIPGVLMQSSNLTTNRISIRGIGARTSFGTNKIRAFYGSIPLTSGNSETIIDDVDVENIGQIEIIKGPLSSIYGAGLGGAILLSPLLSKNKGQSAKINTVHGSYGLLKNSTNYSLTNENASINISYHKLKTDGWRENSAYNREGITMAGELFKKQNSSLTYFSNYTYLNAFIPSSINKKMYDNNPKSGAPTWVAAKGYKEYKSMLGGLAYDFKINENLTNSTSIFINYKDNYETRPFDVLAQYTFATGGRTQFSGNFKIRNKITHFITGIEYFTDNYNGATSENLYKKNNGLGSLQGNLISENNQKRNFYNIFSQIRTVLSKKLELQAGLNYNKSQFKLDNNFPVAINPTQKYSYDGIFSPQLSVLFKPKELQTIYLSASRGFSLPSTEETLTSNGTINPSIKPETGYNFEIGGKFYLLNKNLYSEFAVYRMEIKDLLVAKRIDDDQYVGINAGKTLHQGIEIAIKHNWQINTIFSIASYISASLGKYEFVTFIDNGSDFSGNKLTGVAANKANLGVSVNTNFGFYLSSDFQFVDEIPLNDANSVFSDGYKIINLKSGYRFEILPNLTTHFSAGINNVNNQKYASLILPNSAAFGNATPRYYYPGLPANYYGTVSLNYLF